MSKPLTIECARQSALIRGGKCLTKVYSKAAVAMLWQCKKKHTWTAPYAYIRAGSWCPKCCRENWQPKHKLTLKKLQAIAAGRGGRCVATSYKNAVTKIKWSCSEGHEWDATAANVSRGTWCPECATGTNERICRAYFQALFSVPFPRSRPVWLRGKKRLMELDGYNEKLKIAFEHHGEQHYKVSSFHHRETNSLALQIRADRLKARLCAQQGVRLFVIPQIGSRTPLASLRSVIKQFCFKYKIRVPNHFDTQPVDLTQAYSVPRLQQLKDVAAAQGGQLLSKAFYGEASLHDWRCRLGHVWQARPKAVRYGAWCHICANNKKGTLEQCQAIAVKKQGLCLSKKYINARTTMTWQCKKGHQWKAASSTIVSGFWCPTCAGNARGSIEDAKSVALSRSGLCLSKVYKSSAGLLRWECAERHKWSASLNNVKRGTWCKVCSYVRRKTTYPPHVSSGYERGSIPLMQSIAEARGGTCTSRVYVSNHQKLGWKCHNGHRWQAPPSNIKSGTWCRVCAQAGYRYSKG